MRAWYLKKKKKSPKLCFMKTGWGNSLKHCGFAELQQSIQTPHLLYTYRPPVCSSLAGFGTYQSTNGLSGHKDKADENHSTWVKTTKFWQTIRIKREYRGERLEGNNATTAVKLLLSCWDQSESNTQTQTASKLTARCKNIPRPWFRVGWRLTFVALLTQLSNLRWFSNGFVSSRCR